MPVMLRDIIYYLEKTGTAIEDATILPAEDILGTVEEFWSTDTF